MNAWLMLASTRSTHIQFPCGAVLAVSREFSFAQVKVTMPCDVYTPKVEIRFFSKLAGGFHLKVFLTIL